MPKEYEHCKESYLEKGMDEKKAKAICAGMYYNKHGITVNEAKKRGLKTMLYFSRVKESLKTLLLANGQNLEDYVIIKIPSSLRENEKIKSLFPKIQNKDYAYVAVHKSVIDVSLDGEVVLSLEKLLRKVSENQVSAQNKDNVPYTEGAEEVVLDGKLGKKASTEKKSGKLAEEIKEEYVMTKSLASYKEELTKVFDKLREGEKLSAEEKHKLYGYMLGLVEGNMLNQEDADAVSQAVEEGEKLDQALMDKLSGKGNEMLEEMTEMPENTPEGSVAVVAEVMPTTEEPVAEEEKALEATSVSSQSLEKEDLDDVVALTKSLLSSTKSLDSNVPVFESKADAVKFARMYNLYSNGNKRAFVESADMVLKRKYGNRAKFTVRFE